jgi:hypothetical protein
MVYPGSQDMSLQELHDSGASGQEIVVPRNKVLVTRNIWVKTVGTGGAAFLWAGLSVEPLVTQYRRDALEFIRSAYEGGSFARSDRNSSHA